MQLTLLACSSRMWSFESRFVPFSVPVPLLEVHLNACFHVASCQTAFSKVASFLMLKRLNIGDDSVGYQYLFQLPSMLSFTNIPGIVHSQCADPSTLMCAWYIQEAQDTWSLGVISFEMLTGQPGVSMRAGRDAVRSPMHTLHALQLTESGIIFNGSPACFPE